MKFIHLEITKFVIVGALGAAIEFVLFSAFFHFGLGLVLSNFMALHIAFIICYLLHYHYTFDRPFSGRGMLFSSFVKYALLMYFQFILGTLILWLFIKQLNWMPEISKVLQIGLVTPISYFVQRTKIFHERESV